MGTSEVDTDIRTHTAPVVQIEMRFSFTCIRGSFSTLTTNSCSPPPVSVTLYHESLNYLFQSKPVSLKCLSNQDLKMSIALELTTAAGSLFQ